LVPALLILVQIFPGQRDSPGVDMACERHLLRNAISSVLIVALGLALPRSSHGIDPGTPPGAALEHAIGAFDEAATRLNDDQPVRIARWTGTIHFAIADYSGMSGIAADIEAVLRELSAIARLRVMRVPWGDKRANFTFRPSAGDPAAAGAQPCRSVVSWQDGDMQRAEIVVNLANPGRITRCVNHEAMHGFGFRSHAHAAFSVLSYRQAEQASLSWVDRLMLATLYDARLVPGMDGHTALPIACGVMADKLRATARERWEACHGRRPRLPARVAIFGRRTVEN
jgi:hypothetical protein